jgi:hypothetical protein
MVSRRRRRLVLPHALRPTRASACEVTRTTPASSTLTSVVSIACDLLNKLAIRLEDPFVSALEVNAFGKISQRLVAHPAKNWALLIRHPEP